MSAEVYTYKESVDGIVSQKSCMETQPHKKVSVPEKEVEEKERFGEHGDTANSEHGGNVQWAETYGGNSDLHGFFTARNTFVS